MKEISMDRIDADYAAYTRGEISRGELYKRWKARRKVSLFRAVLNDIRDDWRAIKRDWRALFAD